MYAEERHRTIVNLALRYDRVSVADLATRFDVTTETIRRDLDALDKRGILRRVHGGAVVAENVALIETAITDLLAQRAHHRDHRAEVAVVLVEGEHLLHDHLRRRQHGHLHRQDLQHVGVLHHGALRGVVTYGGAEAVARNAMTYAHPERVVQPVRVDDLAGALITVHGEPFSIMAFTVREGRVDEIHIWADAEQVAGLSAALLGRG